MPIKKSITKLREGAFFLKKNWQVIYSLLLMLLVPATIVLNTFFVVDRFRKTVDVELQRTALIIGKMINVTSMDLFDDTALLQERMEQIAEVIPEVRTMDILKKEGEDFRVAVSLQKDVIGNDAHGTQNILAWYDDQAIAYLTKSPRSVGDQAPLTPEEIRSDDRFWGVVMPLHDESGEKTYLLSAKMSLKVIDDLVKSNLFWSYLWLLITVLTIVLVLASNTRIFEYAILFRKLQEVDKMKDDFISMASHELRAPITAVRGYLSLFLEDAFGKMEEKPKQILKTTFAIATHLGSLVEDLLDVSRIEQGRLKMELVKTNLESVIEEVVSQLHFEAEKKGLAFEYKKPEEPLPQVNIDISRLKQVLINLCSNAIKYTPSGSIKITTEVVENNMIETKVTDTGLGMSPEAQEKLFQKFYRVKTTDTSEISGTGLGLWITKKIVDIMKGKIYITSIEKVGTQASVMLPVVKAGEKKAGESTAPEKKGEEKEAETAEDTPPDDTEKKEEPAGEEAETDKDEQ